jgi:hypothetical protein
LATTARPQTTRRASAPSGPEGFYQRLGFRRTGERVDGEGVAERILTPGG